MWIRNNDAHNDVHHDAYAIFKAHIVNTHRIGDSPQSPVVFSSDCLTEAVLDFLNTTGFMRTVELDSYDCLRSDRK